MKTYLIGVVARRAGTGGAGNGHAIGAEKFIADFLRAEISALGASGIFICGENGF